jgi:hypothetical protein
MTPPAEVLLRWIVGVTKEVRDEHFKAAYLPYPQARQVSVSAKGLTLAIPSGLSYYNF